MANDDTKDPDDKAALRRQLLRDADPWLLVERMRALGFWPADEGMPDEPPAAAAERAKLLDELARLRHRDAKAADASEALKHERIRRWKESKKRRAAARAAKEKAREERRAAWHQARAVSLVHAGEGVSAALQDRQSDESKLSARGLPLANTPAELATQLDVSLATLRWLTFHREAAPLVHYHRYEVPKKVGGTRLISAPKPSLAAVQRAVQLEILSKIELEPEAHGFVPGRSTLTNAAPHVRKKVVINMDLRDFFPTVSFLRVRGMFRSFGYSGSVATMLALLCTEPPRVAETLAGKSVHVAIGERRLPQGACTSPTITNVICRRLDRRLRGHADRYGYSYTRYADDLTFSSAATDRVGALLAGARRIIRDEGFLEHEEKTRIMRRGRAQLVTGLTVNDKVSLSRQRRRELRAILHNTVRAGLSKENRANHPNFAAYLSGCVAYLRMVDPAHSESWAAALERALGHRGS